MSKPYEKVVLDRAIYSGMASVAIYESHPFRNAAIKQAVESSGHTYDTHTGISDDEWCWVAYDWIANPVGMFSKKPAGTIVDKFSHGCGLCDEAINYLNKNPL